jgi:hypothetical protein
MESFFHRSATQKYGKQKDSFEELEKALMKGFSVEPSVVAKMTVNTHIANQIDRIGIDGFALSLLEDTFPDWMPKNLQLELKESLRGFTEDAALWVAESLIDCWSGQALSTIGIKHIDDMLWTLYAKILKVAREKRVNIANHR